MRGNRNNFRFLQITIVLIGLLLSSCFLKTEEGYQKSRHIPYTTFKEELDFLKSHTDIVLLREPESLSMVAISPKLQGRVMTSSSNGFDGRSHGWINRDRFIAGDTLAHINPYGGEERFWLGPEGGPFALFFKPGDEFNLETWQTPRLIDLTPFPVIQKDRKKVTFQEVGRLTNYADFTFEFNIDRSIEILTREEISSALGVAFTDDIKIVGYKSTNQLTNTSRTDWIKESGLLSIWILGMFPPSPGTTVVIPYVEGSESTLGPIVNDSYFGKVPEQRIKIKDGTIFFKADGQFRSKIGLLPSRALFVLGSYDPEREVVTIIKYDKPTDVTDYVNSEWKLDGDPYKGDVINAYNDGPPGENQPSLGPFYELETSSPALALGSGKSGAHIQYTFHIEGARSALNILTEDILSVSLDSIERVFAN